MNQPDLESMLVPESTGDSGMGERRGIVTDDGMQQLGKRIEKFRKQSGIMQDEMAELLGITQSMYSRIERGDARVHGELMIHFVKIFGISADELLGIKSTKQPTEGTIARRWVKRMSRVDELAKRDQDALARIIYAFLERTTNKAAS
jgi:transcriptional regulator with XRE-family HTH domain